MKTMKFTVLLLAALLTPAWGQGSDSASERNAERARIERDKQALQSQAEAKEQVCYQQFAVNDCLSQVRRDRRAALAELQRQTLALSDQERQERAARARAQQAAREADHAEKVRQAEALPAAGAPQAKQAQSAASAMQQADQAQSAAQQRAADYAQRQRQHAEKVAAEAEQKKRFDAKQRQAQERQLEHARRQAEKTKPTATPLPAAASQ